METVDHLLGNLCERIQEREQRAPLSFKDFMAHAAVRPTFVFRNIFQVFHDMVYSYVGDGVDEYPEDPESIHYVYYDCGQLFEEGTDHPFFADRLFANRLVHHIASFRRGAQQNRIYIFEGPHGCGKSTFLNNLLLKFEQYTRTEDGTSFEALWRLDKKELGAVPEREARVLRLVAKEHAGDLGGGVLEIEVAVSGCRPPEARDLPGDPDQPDLPLDDAPGRRHQQRNRDDRRRGSAGAGIARPIGVGQQRVLAHREARPTGNRGRLSIIGAATGTGGGHRGRRAFDTGAARR